MVTSPHPSQSVAPFGDVAMELLLEAFPGDCVVQWLVPGPGGTPQAP